VVREAVSTAEEDGDGQK